MALFRCSSGGGGGIFGQNTEVLHGTFVTTAGTKIYTCANKPRLIVWWNTYGSSATMAYAFNCDTGKLYRYYSGQTSPNLDWSEQTLTYGIYIEVNGNDVYAYAVGGSNYAKPYRMIIFTD